MSTTIKFTDGPWHVGPTGDVDNRYGCGVCTLYADETSDANAHLIAAAPALYAELVKARDTFADVAHTLRMLRHGVAASACDIAKESINATLALVEQP